MTMSVNSMTVVSDSLSQIMFPFGKLARERQILHHCNLDVMSLPSDKPCRIADAKEKFQIIRHRFACLRSFDT